MGERDRWIEAGAILRPHGIRGEVVVDLKSDLLACFTEGVEVRFTTVKGQEGSLDVERAREHKGRLIIKFKGVETRDDADSLRAHTVWLTREQVGPLDEGRWFVQDILGVDVYTDEGEHLGEIAEVLNMSANDVYVVRAEGREILLPAIEQVIKEVDLEDRKMVVHLMEGLR